LIVVVPVYNEAAAVAQIIRPVLELKPTSDHPLEHDHRSEPERHGDLLRSLSPRVAAKIANQEARLGFISHQPPVGVLRSLNFDDPMKS
jgi:hypothetical protein